MTALRAALVAVILVNLALLAVYFPLRATSGRYSLARHRRDLQALLLEHQKLLYEVALERRPERVARRAAEFGIELSPVEYDRIAWAGVERSAARPSR